MIFSKGWKILLVLLVVLGFFALVFWGTLGPESTPSPAPAASPTPTQTIAPPSLSGTSLATSPESRPPLAPPALPASGIYTSDQAEEIISGLLVNDAISHEQVARQLLGLLPNFPAEEQEEAAQHISNLSDDSMASEYAKMITANSLPAPAAEVLFSDLMNRPHEILIPAISQIADQPAHPQKEDSIEILEVLYGPPEDGLNWQNWIARQMAADQE